MCHAGYVSTETLLLLPWMAALSGLAGWLALRSWRRSDPVDAVRWTGWALVPPALLLTGTGGLVSEIAGAVTSWAADLVFNPFMWAGVLVGGVAVVMIGGATAVRRRRGPKQVDAPPTSRAVASQEQVGAGTSGARRRRHGRDRGDPAAPGHRLSVPVRDVRALAATVWRHPARAGGRRLVLVDGRAGAGKTRLAAALADALRRDGRVNTIATDDLYEGWHGLPGVGRRVRDQLVRPLVDGVRPRPVRWDWHASRWQQAVPLPAADVWLLEGVGSWSRSLAQWTTLLVWVETPEPLRKARALARDGDTFAPHWDDWAADERRLLTREAPRSHADVVWPGG